MTSGRIESRALRFDLPPDRIAQRPRPYEEQRLLVYERGNGSIGHRRFGELLGLLRAGDLLVVNNSRVVPARLGHADGTVIFVLDPGRSEFRGLRALCPSRPAVGEGLELPGARFTVAAAEPSSEVRVGDLEPERPFESLVSFLEAYGSSPIPPYVRREPDERDAKEYQTIFASDPGSIAAPTAGLHFHPELVSALGAAGIGLVEITLHVGYGTFRQVRSTYVDEHSMDPERYQVAADVAREIWQARRAGRRVIAVGTTATRTLETIAPRLGGDHRPGALEGESRLFIYPPYEFRAIDGLITNLHYPQTPVMSLTAAFCGGVEELMRIYREALAEGYLFYSYGDAMLVV